MRSATLVALFFMAVGIVAEPAYAGSTDTTCIRGQQVVGAGGRACAPRPRTRVASRIPPRPPPPRWYASRSDTIRTPARTTTYRAPVRTYRTARYVPPPPPPPPLYGTAQPTTRVVRSYPTPRRTYRAPVTHRVPVTRPAPVVRRPAQATITYTRPAPRSAPRGLITRPARTSASCNNKSPRTFLRDFLPKSSCST